MLLVERLEQLRVRGLRDADEQVAIIAQSVAKDVLQLLLQFAVEIDEQIAAGDQVQLRERRIAQYAVSCKHHRVTDFAGNAVVVTFGAEITRKPRLGDVRDDGCRIYPFTSRRERALIDI